MEQIWGFHQASCSCPPDDDGIPRSKWVQLLKLLGIKSLSIALKFISLLQRYKPPVVQFCAIVFFSLQSTKCRLHRFISLAIAECHHCQHTRDMHSILSYPIQNRSKIICKASNSTFLRQQCFGPMPWSKNYLVHQKEFSLEKIEIVQFGEAKTYNLCMKILFFETKCNDDGYLIKMNQEHTKYLDLMVLIYIYFTEFKSYSYRSISILVFAPPLVLKVYLEASIPKKPYRF